MRAVILWILISLSSIRIAAQPQAEQYNVWIEKATAASDKGLYLEAAWAYSKAFTAGPGSDDPWTDRYSAAVAWAKAARPDSAIAQLWYLARHTGYQEFAEVELEPAFKRLHTSKDWNPLLAQIRWNRYVRYPVTDTALSETLARMLVLDQRYRRELEHFPHGSLSQNTEALAIIDSMRVSDSLNIRLVDALLQRQGWPSEKQIGVRGVGTVFIILQHADSATQARYLQTLRDAHHDGQLPAADLAMFEDRLALRQTGEQLYGTQIVCDGKGCRVDRLKDALQVDKRRKAVGLPPLQDYVNAWNIVWDAATYENERKAAQAK